MLFQPHLWLQGLIPVALVAGGSLWWKQAAIERDLGERAARAIAAESPTVDGKPWASVTMQGRDAVITGAAPAETDLTRSATLADATYGVRLADIPRTLLPDANPFGWSARRDGKTVTLSGFVAPDGSRARIIDAVKQAIPGVEIVDTMVAARNVPSAALDTALAAIGQLGKLTSGSVSLAGTTLRVTGGAPDAATGAAVSAAVSALPQGASPARVNIETPGTSAATTAPASPAEASQGLTPAAPGSAQVAAAPPAATPGAVASWTAVKSGTGIQLTGPVASEDARRRILAAARAATAGRVTDAMTVMADVPAAVEAQAIAVLRQMADLVAARAAIAGATVSLTGEASDPDGYQRLSVTPLRPQAGFSLGDVAIAPPKVELFTWRARKRDAILSLDGLAPTSDARVALLTEAARGGLRVVDDMRVATGLIDGVDYGRVTGRLLDALSRLAEGSVALTGSRVTVTGQAPDAATAEAIRASLAAIGAPLTVTSDISVAAAPPAPVAAASPPAAAPTPAPSAAPSTAPATATPAPTAPAAPQVAAAPASPAPLPVVDCGARITAALSGDKLLFEYWKSDTRPEAGSILDRLAGALRGCRPPNRIEVSGHADIRNVSNSNQILSELRARTVRDELVRRGVDPTILVAVGYAATRPAAPNDTEENMQLNRRVELTDLTGR